MDKCIYLTAIHFEIFLGNFSISKSQIIVELSRETVWESLLDNLRRAHDLWQPKECDI